MVRIRRQLDILTAVVVLAGVLPVYLYLDLPVQIVIAGALLIGVWCDRKRTYFIPAPAATILSILVFIFYAVQIDRDHLALPALNIAILLLAVRLLTEKQGRHFLQIYLLAGFALAGSTLLTLHLSFLPLLLVMVCSAIYGLVLLCFVAGDPGMRMSRDDFRTLLKTTLLLPIGSLLLAIVFFFILPRTQHPLWDFLNPGALSGVGFSEEVSPGSVSGTAADLSVAFRAESRQWPPQELYWRMTVLNRLDGDTWKRESIAAAGMTIPVGGQEARITIFPEAGRRKFLVTLDSPVSLSGLGYVGRRDNIVTPQRLTQRARSYEVIARVGGRLARSPGGAEAAYLELPTAIAPRARAVVRNGISALADQKARIEAIKNFFRSQELTYATLGLPTSGDPVDTFLFDSRRGYCEHFASAFAVMLREAGVPSRLVGGYFGGDYNPLGGYYMVGERAAHVWVEYLDASGYWTRYDPNHLAARMESGLLATIGQRPPGWRQLVDAVDYYWTQTVVTLDFVRQIEALRALRAQYRAADRQNLKLWTAVVTGVVLMLGGAGLFWRRRRRRPVHYNRLIRQFLKRVAQSGQVPADHIGLFELARRSGQDAALEFARIYGQAFYRDRDLTADEMAELKRLLRRIGQG